MERASWAAAITLCFCRKETAQSLHLAAGRLWSPWAAAGHLGLASGLAALCFAVEGTALMVSSLDHLSLRD